jgi:hypothetical protein
VGHSDTMQLLTVKAGVTAMDGYHGGAPQIIHLDVLCTGDPKVKQWKVPTKEAVEDKGKSQIQFNPMYVCTLKVAEDRHGLTLQLQGRGNRGLWLSWEPKQHGEHQTWRRI